MIRELIDLQHRLQEAENLIQRLEDQLQHLIDKEHRNESPAIPNWRVSSVEITRPDSRPQYSYGARYVSSELDASTVDTTVEPVDAAYCVGREGPYANYRRPF